MSPIDWLKYCLAKARQNPPRSMCLTMHLSVYLSILEYIQLIENISLSLSLSLSSPSTVAKAPSRRNAPVPNLSRENGSELPANVHDQLAGEPQSRIEDAVFRGLGCQCSETLRPSPCQAGAKAHQQESGKPGVWRARLPKLSRVLGVESLRLCRHLQDTVAAATASC